MFGESSRYNTLACTHLLPPAALPLLPPLPAECDNWCEYPVADRPNAVRQFLDAAKKDPSMIKVEGVGGTQAAGRARKGLGCVRMGLGGVDGHRGGCHNRNTSCKTKTGTAAICH